MPCVTCKLVNCQSGKDITLFSLQDALFFNGVPLSFIVDCPEGFYCPPGTFPRTVTYPPGTFQIPHPPNPPPGQPIILQLMGCQSLVQRILPAGSSAAAIQAAANEIIQEVAAQQAQCDTNPPLPPDPNNPPGPQPPRPPPSGGGTLPPNNPTPPFMNQAVFCRITPCPGDLVMTLVNPFPSWVTFIDIGILRGAAGVFGGSTQAAANATAQVILNNLCDTAFSSNRVICAGGGGGCVTFDALAWGAPTYVDGGVQTVTGSWVGANFSFSIAAPVPNTLASATNSATAPLTVTTPLIGFLDVTWVSDPGNGALEFSIQVSSVNLGVLQLVDQSSNLPAWNTTTRYTFLIGTTTADTLLVAVTGSINDGIARTASISAMLTCIPAFGNVEKTAHVDCDPGCSGAGGNATVAANTIYRATQQEADDAAQAQANQEAADAALLPANCGSTQDLAAQPWSGFQVAVGPGTTNVAPVGGVGHMHLVNTFHDTSGLAAQAGGVTNFNVGPCPPTGNAKITIAYTATLKENNADGNAHPRVQISVTFNGVPFILFDYTSPPHTPGSGCFADIKTGTVSHIGPLLAGANQFFYNIALAGMCGAAIPNQYTICDATITVETVP